MSVERMSRELAKQIVNAGRPGQLLGLSESSATLVFWEPNDLRGTVRYNGVIMEDLPVMATIDAFGWQAGDEVVIRKWYPPNGRRRAGFGSWYIAGRIYRPGAANAQRVLDSLRSEVAKQVSAEVFAARVHNASFDNPFGEFTISTDYTDLATVGPTVSNVDISPAGKALVILSASLIPAANEGCAMGVQISGATTVAPDDGKVLALEIGASTVVPTSATVLGMDGLNPGLHTFQAKYKSQFGGSCGFGRQGMTIIAY